MLVQHTSPWQLSDLFRFRIYSLRCPWPVFLRVATRTHQKSIKRHRSRTQRTIPIASCHGFGKNETRRLTQKEEHINSSATEWYGRVDMCSLFASYCQNLSDIGGMLARMPATYIPRFNKIYHWVGELHPIQQGFSERGGVNRKDINGLFLARRVQDVVATSAKRALSFSLPMYT